MKASAALLYSGSLAAGVLTQVAQATLRKFHTWCPRESRPEFLHHDLYFVEGALLSGVAASQESYLCHAAAVLQQLLEANLSSLCGEDDSAPACSRSDVLAQILRAGCFLQGVGFLPRHPWREWLPSLARKLSESIGPDGAMYFRPCHPRRPRHVNIWSGLFAAQALIWYRLWESSDISLDLARWLV